MPCRHGIGIVRSLPQVTNKTTNRNPWSTHQHEDTEQGFFFSTPASTLAVSSRLDVIVIGVILRRVRELRAQCHVHGDGRRQQCPPIARGSLSTPHHLSQAGTRRAAHARDRLPILHERDLVHQLFTRRQIVRHQPPCPRSGLGPWPSCAWPSSHSSPSWPSPSGAWPSSHSSPSWEHGLSWLSSWPGPSGAWPSSHSWPSWEHWLSWLSSPSREPSLLSVTSSPSWPSSPVWPS